MLNPKIDGNSAKNRKKITFWLLNIFLRYGMIILVTVQYSS